MKISSVSSSKEWDLFVTENNGSFLQSTVWANFKSDYDPCYSLEVRENGIIKGVCHFFSNKTPFGNYLYAPHGPHSVSRDYSIALLKEAKSIATEEKTVFIFALFLFLAICFKVDTASFRL